MTGEKCDLYYICARYDYIKFTNNSDKFLIELDQKKAVDAKFDQHI